MFDTSVTPLEKNRKNLLLLLFLRVNMQFSRRAWKHILICSFSAWTATRPPAKWHLKTSNLYIIGYTCL